MVYVRKVYNRHPFQEVREEKLIFLGFETKNYNLGAVFYNFYWFVEKIVMVVIVLEMPDDPMTQLTVFGGAAVLHILLALNLRPWGKLGPTAHIISN